MENLKARRPFLRPTHIWEDNIKNDLKETGCNSADWTQNCSV